MATTVYSSWSQASSISSNRHYRAFLTYSVSTTDTTVTVSAYSGVQLDNSISADIKGTQSMTGYSSKSGTAVMTYANSNPTLKKTTVSTQTYTYTRTTSAQTKTLAASAVSTESGFHGDTVTKSVTITVPALANYTITYNANGGSGEPDAQTKTYGQAITLSSTAPTREGYTFRGWATSANGSAVYQPGGSYTANASVTLYAVWEANTYTVSYNANSGSGTITAQTKTYGQALTLSNGSGFTRDNHSLTGWNTAADGSGTAYALSQVLPASYMGNMTLYAQWHLDYIKPVISSLECWRVDASDNEKDDGTYLHLSFTYVGGTVDGGSTHFTPTCKLSINGGAETTVTVSGGTYSARLSGTYSADTTHSVTVRLYDASHDTTGTSATVDVSTATYPIDMVGDGTNVYMGVMMPAKTGQKLTVPELFNVGMIGAVQMYAGQTAPNGWLFCDGSVLNIADYPDLADVIGSTYGGNGTTTFALPDMRGRVPVGVNNASLPNGANSAYSERNLLNGNGGAEEHTLQTSEIPAHTHGSKSLAGTFRVYEHNTWTTSGIVSHGTNAKTASGFSSGTVNGGNTFTVDATHEHTSVGGGSAHNNMQPFQVLNYIIFTGIATI